MTPTRSAILIYLAAAPVAAQSLGEAPQMFVDEPRVETKAVAIGAVPPPDRASVVRTYHTRFLPAELTASGWAGSVSSCTQGTTSAAFKQSVIDRLSAYRAFAGLPKVGLFTDATATNTQRAALMMSANNALNHSPLSSWKCYTTAGGSAAYYSNLALGAYGYDAIDLYMDDPGTGNEPVGHRRWLLFPPQANVATGDIPGGSAPAANALWVAGPHGARPANHDGVVTWPPRGYVPWDALPALSNRWSLSHPQAYFVGANVAMTGPAGNIPVTLETLKSGYGDETLVWRPTGIGYTRPDGDTTYRITLTSNNSTFGLPSPLSYSVTVIDAETLDPALAGDFDGDGREDLLWRNEMTGQTAVWLMNGSNFRTQATLMQNADWRPVLTGDFNGDGRTDMLWRNDGTGVTAVWLMNGLQMIGNAWLVSDRNWLPTHTGDLDGNGTSDIVWRNASTGQTALWLMGGLTSSANTIFRFDGAPGWEVAHVADLDGDGRADIVARNSANGATAAWRMNGLTAIAGATLVADPAWTATHVADLNGDRKADLIWRNSATGATHAWLLNGLAVGNSALLLNAKAWRVVQVGDFDGDGRSDIVWRNPSTGQTHLWLMNGLGMTSSTALLTHADWQPARIGNFDGNKGAAGAPMDDILWRNSRSGLHAVWLMNGGQMVGNAHVLSGAAWWASP